MILTAFISFQDTGEMTVGHTDSPDTMKDAIHQNACSMIDICSIGSTWHLGNSVLCILYIQSIKLMHNNMVIFVSLHISGLKL
jgi:hypothetical protein